MFVLSFKEGLSSQFKTAKARAVLPALDF